MDIEKRLFHLEKKLKTTIPGTMINRVLMDTTILKREFLKPLHDRECHLVWSVGIGLMDMPKVFGYGHTIDEAIKNVEKKLKH